MTIANTLSSCTSLVSYRNCSTDSLGWFGLLLIELRMYCMNSRCTNTAAVSKKSFSSTCTANDNVRMSAARSIYLLFSCFIKLSCCSSMFLQLAANHSAISYEYLAIRWYFRLSSRLSLFSALNLMSIATAFVHDCPCTKNAAKSTPLKSSGCSCAAYSLIMIGMRLSTTLNSPLAKRDSPVVVARSFNDFYNHNDFTYWAFSLDSILLRLSVRSSISVSR